MIDREARSEKGSDAARDVVGAHHDPQDARDRATHAEPDEAAPAWGAMQARSAARHGGALGGKLHTPAVELPYRSELERSFGVSLADVEAHVGETDALREQGGIAAAEGNVVAFASPTPSLGDVAHEIAHVVQARSGGAEGDSESEARKVEGNVAAGMAAGPITAGASGVHLKDPTDAPQQVSAREFLRVVMDDPDYVYLTVRTNGMLRAHPYGKYITRQTDFLNAMFSDWADGVELTAPLHAKIDGLIAPESVDAVVNPARRVDSSIFYQPGPAHDVYALPVGKALGNVVSRRLQESLTRMLPRYVNLVTFDTDAEGNTVETARPKREFLTPSHPMDRVVALGLCDPMVEIDAVAFAKEHPDRVKASDHAQGRKVNVRFPYERGLWHWVEAKAPDGSNATAEEVAVALFGNADQAYRLTPMAPLFGFRARDVMDFVDDKRIELNHLASAHHPDPEMLNQGDVAAYQRQQHDKLLAEQGYLHADGPDGGVTHGIPPTLDDVDANDPNAPIPTYGYPTFTDVDPVVELAAATGDTLALEQAKAANSDGKEHDALAVHERLGDCVDLLAPIHDAFTALHIATDSVEALRTRLETKRADVRETAVDTTAWYALADQQAKVLKRIAKGAGDTSAHLLLYGGVNSSEDATSMLPSPDKLPDAAREPVLEAGEAFNAAFAAVPLPELAVSRVEHAEALARTLRITVLERSVQETLPTLQDSQDTLDDRHDDGADYNPFTMESRGLDLLFDLSRLRVDIDRDPAAAEKELAEVSNKASDYTFEMSIIANLEALDLVWRQIENSEDFWKSLPHEIGGNLLQDENRTFYAAFRDQVFEPYKTAVENKDDAGKKAAKDAFRSLVEQDSFKTHFKRIHDHLVDDAHHKKWTKIIVGIAIAVVAMGLGQMWLGAYLAAGGGAVLGAIGAATIEVGVGATLNMLILDAPPTAGGLITGFAGAGLMYGIVGRSLALGRAAGAAPQVTEGVVTAHKLKAGQLVVDTAKEFFLTQALGMVQLQVEKAINEGKALTEQEIEEAFIQNIAGLIGMKIGQRVVDITLDPMKPLRQVGARHDIDVQGLLDEREALILAAKDAEAAKNPELAQQLIEREKRFLERERDVRERLLELGKKHPGKIAASKLDDLAAMPDHASEAQVVQAQAMMSLEEIGPGLYRADARGLDAVLSLHKESGSRVVGIETDPHTGLRSIKLETADGSPIRIKEKAGDVGERVVAPVPAAEANQFEQWLETQPLHADPVQSDMYRSRLREYYARDPQGAIVLAEKYGYAPMSIADTAPLATKGDGTSTTHPSAQPKSDSQRAYEQFVYERRGEDPQMSRIGDEPTMSRSDFEEMYAKGYEYDPVTRRWVIGTKTTSAGHTRALVPGGPPTQVIGTVHSEALGHQVLRKLVNGEAEALRLVGIEPPTDFNSQANEWALGRRTSDQAIVLIRGDKGEINWSQLPGVEDLAHSHPLLDPITGEPRHLTGSDGSGAIDLNDLGSFDPMDMVYLLPSAGDLRFISLGGRMGHRVHTPYVSLGDGRIGNPVPGHMLDTVEIVVTKSEPYALFRETSEIVVWKGEIEVWAGDRLLGTIDIYQRRHSGPGWGADMPTFHPESDWFLLPADHPVRKAADMANPLVTSMSDATKIGNVEVDTVRKLASVGFDPAETTHHALLGSLSAKDAEALHFMVTESLGGRAAGSDIKTWLERLKTDKAAALADARLARRELDADPGATFKVDADGNLLFTSSTRVDVPAIVVDHVKGVAGSEAKGAVKKYDIEQSEQAAVIERVTKEATKAGEDAYVAALGHTDAKVRAKAKDAASKETRAKAVELARQEGIAAAERRARAEVASGGAFDLAKLDAKSKQQLTDFRAGTTGMAARRLAGQLPGMKNADFIAAMGKEVSDGNCPAPRSIPINGPPPQTMQMWEYADGTEIRYKPLGDMDHPKPTFTIEVKKDPSVPDSGRDDAAFKVNADGDAVPKNDLELDNPYSKHTQNVQYEAFENAVLGPIHFELDP